MNILLRLLALAGVASLAACASQADSGQCEALRKQIIPLTSGGTVATEQQMRRQLARLSVCGFDTARIGHAGPILGALMLRKLNAGQKSDITYGELLTELNEAHLELMPPTASPTAP